jgi:hypothetical protein
MDPSEESTATRWIRQRAQALIDTGVGAPDAFQQARVDYVQLTMRGGVRATSKSADPPKK